jgi:hypothetical protein
LLEVWAVKNQYARWFYKPARLEREPAVTSVEEIRSEEKQKPSVGLRDQQI